MFVRTSHQPQSADDVIQVIKANVFATMVTFSADGPIASHLPFMIDVLHPGLTVAATAHVIAAPRPKEFRMQNSECRMKNDSLLNSSF